MFSAKIREKSIEKMIPMRLLAVLLIPAVAFILGATAPEIWAEDKLEFGEAKFIIEFNFSDEDLGVQAFVDGVPWKEVEIENPNGDKIAEVEGKRSIADQGFAELFFESGEPSLVKVSIQEFLARFPEGTYKFEGETIEEKDIEGQAMFTHVIPCGPEIVSAEFENGNFIIRWNKVETVVDPTKTVPENVVCVGSGNLKIVGYQVIVETETDSGLKIYRIDLPASATSVTVPPEFLALGTEFQYEVLAIEASGNQTITLDNFTTP